MEPSEDLDTSAPDEVAGDASVPNGDADESRTVDRPRQADRGIGLLRTGGGGLDGGLWPSLAAQIEVLDAGRDEPTFDPADWIGREIGHVTLESLIGRGGMGAVYRGFDSWLERPVAVKMLRPDRLLGARARERFRAEARALSRLDDPGICRIHDLIEQDGDLFLILELVEGRPLDQVFLGDGDEPLPLGTRLRILREVARALAVAHAARLVHRDLKPANVLWSGDAEVDLGDVKVLDFGISRLLDSAGSSALPESREREGSSVLPPAGVAEGRSEVRLTETGRRIGTVAYMSPEQARGEALDGRSDIYSLGLLLVEAVSQRPARDRTSSAAEQLEAAASGERVPLDDVPTGLRPIVETMLAEAPAERPAADVVADRIDEYLDRPRRFRRRWAVAGLALLVLALLVVTARWSEVRATARPLLGPEGGRVLLLPLENETGDPSLDWIETGLAELLAETLGEIDGVDVLGGRALQSRQRAAGLAALPNAADLVALRNFGQSVEADLTVVSRLERHPRGVALRYQTLGAGRDLARERAILAPSATIAADLLSQRLSSRLSPSASARGFSAGYSDDPVVNRLFAQGSALLLGGDLPEARAYFDVVRIEEPDMLAPVVSLTSIEMREGNFEAAEALLEQLLVAAETRDEPAVRTKAIAQLGRAFGNRGRFEEALVWLEPEIANLPRVEAIDPSAAGSLHSALAFAYQSLDRQDEAETHLLEAIRLHRETGHVLGVGTAQIQLAHLAMRQDREQRSRELLADTLILAKENDVLTLEADVEGTLSSLDVAAGQYEDSLRHGLRSIELYQRLGQSVQETIMHTNVGETTLILGQAVAADEHLRKGLAGFEDMGNERGVRHARLLLAQLHLRLGDLEEASAFLEGSGTYQDSDNWKATITRARLAYEQGRYREALALAEEARGETEGRWADRHQLQYEAFQQAAASGRRVEVGDELVMSRG